MSAPQGPPAPPPNSGEPQQPYPGQPYPGQPYPGQPYPGQPSQPAYPTPAYANAPAGKPARITEGPEIGLPPGVTIAELGPRLLAWLIEASVPIVLGLVLGLVAANSDGAAPVVLAIIATLLQLGWIGFLGWRYTTEAAGPGTKLMGLQLVGMKDGRPLGWGPWILRYLVFAVVSGVSILNIVFWILLVLNPRRQGWHDLAVGSIMIKAREVAPRPAKPGAEQPQPAAPDVRAEAEPTVGIPTSYGTPTPQGAPPASYGPGAHYGPVSRSYGGPSSVPSAPQSAPSATSAPQSAPSAPSSAPSASAPASAPEPAPVVPAPEPAPEPELTPAPSPGPAPVPPASAPTVTVDDREVTVTGLVLFGRNPQRGPGEEDAEIVKVKDEARTVSKTHLALGVDGGGLWVEDRGSTNGSAVTSPDGVYRLLGAGERVSLQPGWTVAFGQHTIAVG